VSGRDPNGIDAFHSLVQRCRGLAARTEPRGPDPQEAGSEDCWGYYWRHVAETIGRTPYAPFADFLERKYGGPGRAIEILSLGSGSCERELRLARTQRSPYFIRCVSSEGSALAEATRGAQAEGLNVEVVIADLNSVEIEPGRFHVILAEAVLSKVIELEHLLEQIAAGLVEGGCLQVVDVVGKSRELLWEENEQLVNSVLAGLPVEITGGRRVEVGVPEGESGLRQEETLTLIDRYFQRELVHRHGAFMRFLGTDAELAVCFDPRNPVRRRFLDLVIAIDDAAVEHGIARPLELWGVFTPRPERGGAVRRRAPSQIVSVDRLIADNPAFHDAGAGTSENWSTSPDVLRFLHGSLRPGMRTLETGAGQSTVAMALAGARHTCVTPSRREAERIEAYLASLGLGGAVTFLVGSSDVVLPRSGVIPAGLDLVFIDGAHRFPFPILDWHFAESRLRVGGLLGIDDCWIPSVRCLLDYLLGEEEWAVEREFGSTVFLRKLAEAPRGKDWLAQRYNSAERGATRAPGSSP